MATERTSIHWPSLAGSFVQNFFAGDTKSALKQVAFASVLPILTSAVWYSSRTVVEVVDGEQSLWVQLWMSHQGGAIRRVRRLFLLSARSMMSRRSHDPFESQNKQEESDRFAPPKLTFVPASGVSAWAWFGWWPVSVASRSLELAGRQDPYSSGQALSNGYKITVWFAPRGVDVVKNIVLEGRNMWLAKRAEKTEIWQHDPHCMPARFDVATRKSRPLSTVIVEGGTKEKLCADAIRFLQSEEWYVRKGIPYRRGYLLFGPPGCGKTSLIYAIAGELRLPIVLIPLNSRRIDDSSLLSALTAAPRDSIVLIEDVDCALPTQTTERDMMYGRQPVTLSGLLNAVDGVAAQEGRLLFMTTNHKDRLHDALIRPGRVDVQHHVGCASKIGAGELFDQFFASSQACSKENDDTNMLNVAREAFIKEVEDKVHSFAKLQGVLMQARDEPGLAAGFMRDLSAVSVPSPEANGHANSNTADTAPNEVMDDN